MAEEEQSVRAELGRLAEICNVKRGQLLEGARSKDAARKHLHVAAGMMALLSGIITTAVFTDLLGGITIKILTALLAFGSGAVSLVGSTYVDNKEVDEMYRGAGEYLSLRDRVDIARMRKSITLAQLETALGKAREDYGKLTRYDRYVRGSPVNPPTM